MPDTPNPSETGREKLSRAEGSRINGAHSKGPRTIEGKARSSLNRTTHGMYSSRVVLHNECQQTYNDLSNRFFTLFQPNDIFEHELVTNIVNARWKIRRLEAASAAHLDLAMEEARKDFERNYDQLDIRHEHALAYRAIEQVSGKSDLMGRHEDRQHRIFDRSYRLLSKHRGKAGVIPSQSDMFEVECDLPNDNMTPYPPESEPECANDRLEPEIPADPPLPPIVYQKPKPKKSKNEPDEPYWMLDSETNAAVNTFFRAVDIHPGLKEAVLDGLRRYQEAHDAEQAA